MTSSERHLKPGQKRWDYSVRRYKEHRDVFCEPGLFSIIVLACGRPELTRQTVLGTLENVKLYPSETEWVFIENGQSEENYEFFQSLELERKVVLRQRNFGINNAINQGWALSRGEYVMILENDWQTMVSGDFLSVAQDVFEEQPLVGMIQLRDPRDPNENHGLGKTLFNPWTCDPRKCRDDGVLLTKQQTKGGHTYLLANHRYGINNNPIIIRKKVYRECGFYPEPEVGTDPRHGETEYQERVGDTEWLTAYIGIPLYSHMGNIQTKAN